jgi:hypothetical protein
MIAVGFDPTHRLFTRLPVEIALAVCPEALNAEVHTRSTLANSAENEAQRFMLGRDRWNRNILNHHGHRPGTGIALIEIYDAHGVEKPALNL